ncbi:MAG: siphovirus Gp157 family protein [Microcystaceae cyanobacterium]
MTTLWELSDDLITLESLIEDIQDDETVSNEDKEAKIESLFENWLKASDNFDDKALRVAAYIRHQESVAEARKNEAKRLRELANQSQKQADRLRGYLIRQMKLTGKTKVEGIDGKLSLRTLPAKVAIANPDQIPEQYLKVEVSPRLSEIKKAIKANPDSIDWAYLEDSGNYSLSIR